MRIDSASVFTFYFPYEGHEIAIPVRADSKEEASQKLLNFFSQWGLEISLETPKAAPAKVQTAPNGIDPFMLQLRIEDLVREIMPVKKPKGAQTVDRLVKEWTGFPYEEANYAAIISVLEGLKKDI